MCRAKSLPSSCSPACVTANQTRDTNMPSIALQNALADVWRQRNGSTPGGSERGASWSHHGPLKGHARLTATAKSQGKAGSQLARRNITTTWGSTIFSALQTAELFCQ